MRPAEACQAALLLGQLHVAVTMCQTWCNEWTCKQISDCGECGPEHGCAGKAPPPDYHPRPPPPPSPPKPPPLHDLSVGEADYWTYGSRMYTNAFGSPAEMPLELTIKGVSWFGMETGQTMVGGANKRPLSEITQFIKEQGFNAVRIPFAADMVTSFVMPVPVENVDKYNPELSGQSYILQLAAIAEALGDAGLLMLLDLHVLKAGVWPDGGSIGDMSALKDAWGMVAETLCDAHQYWNVFAAGIKNEPYNMYWGEPPAGSASAYRPGNRFDQAVEEVAALVHRKCPRWLIFAQGVGQCQGNAVDTILEGYFYGKCE